MKYIITENQLSKILSHLTKTPEKNFFISKIKELFGADNETVGRIILQSIKDGKAIIKNFEDSTQLDPPAYPKYQKFDIRINGLPIEIEKHENRYTGTGNNFFYRTKIRMFANEYIQMSNRLSEKIFEALLEQQKNNS